MADLANTVTPNAQLSALLGKQQDFTKQLETNTTKAANVGRLGTADALESQKAAAKSAAAASGRPWTNDDERQWAARQTRINQQNENQMLLGREATQQQSLANQGTTIGQATQEQQGAQSLNLQGEALANQREATQAGVTYQNKALEYGKTQSQAELDAQQQYQQAQLKLQQAQLASQQAQQLSTLMYGPATQQIGPPSTTVLGGASRSGSGFSLGGSSVSSASGTQRGQGALSIGPWAGPTTRGALL